MILRDENSFQRAKTELRAISHHPSRLLMATPNHYRVEYAINEFMKDGEGNLKKVDPHRAKDQWTDLKQSFEKYLSVETIESDPSCPDMVYAANHGLPIWDINSHEPAFIPAKMASSFRAKEVAHFEKWYQKNGYRVLRLSGEVSRFEGMGDALVHPGKSLIWGGVGPRTEITAYEEISRLTDYAVVPLNLVSPLYYHLDTCFSILDAQSVLICPDAFDRRSIKLIREGFENVLEVSNEENQRYFLCNCFCPDTKRVFVQRGSERFKAKLKHFGFEAVEVETGEFLKGGGSVFCLKMAVF